MKQNLVRKINLWTRYDDKEKIKNINNPFRNYVLFNMTGSNGLIFVLLALTIKRLTSLREARIAFDGLRTPLGLRALRAGLTPESVPNEQTCNETPHR